jgi:hypothetical protein
MVLICAHHYFSARCGGGALAAFFNFAFRNLALAAAGRRAELRQN